jgi:hypothetical protein
MAEGLPGPIAHDGGGVRALPEDDPLVASNLRHGQPTLSSSIGLNARLQASL